MKDDVGRRRAGLWWLSAGALLAVVAGGWMLVGGWDAALTAARRPGLTASSLLALAVVVTMFGLWRVLPRTVRGRLDVRRLRGGS